MTREELNSLTVMQLRAVAKEQKVKLGAGINKEGIIEKLLLAQEAAAPAPQPAAETPAAAPQPVMEAPAPQPAAEAAKPAPQEAPKPEGQPVFR